MQPSTKQVGEGNIPQSVLDELRWWKRRAAFLGPSRELSPDWAELWKRWEMLYPASEYPIVNQIHLAIFRRFASLTAPLPPRLSHEARCLIRLGEYKELEDLMGLVFPRPTAKERGVIMERAVSKLKHDQATALLHQLKRRLAGRPADKRAKALKALEMKMLSPDLTWKDVGIRIKYDDQEQHKPYAINLPAEIRNVKRTLRKYCIRWS